jgi:NitT/TauT family transport system substrate-binding protein
MARSALRFRVPTHPDIPLIFEESTMTRSRLRSTLATFCGLALCLALLAWGAAPVLAAKAVLFSTDGGPSGRHAYFFVALEKGYYSDAGLDVTIVGGRGSASVVKEVAAGSIKIGFADLGTLAIARGNEGVPVKMTAVGYRKAPHGLIVLKDSGIRTAKDLVGKTLADTAGSSNVAMWPAYAKAAGIDPQSVKWVFADFNALPGMLMTGQVDAIGQYIVGVPLLAKRAAPKEIAFVGYKDAGLELYSNGIVAREDTLKDDPAMVKAFTLASMRGLSDACKDPAEAGRIMHKHIQLLESDIIEGETKMVCELAQDADTRAHGLGYLNPTVVQKTIDLVASVFNLKKKVTPDDLIVPGMTSADIK